VSPEREERERALQAFEEWQAHVDAGRIGGRSTEAKSTDGETDEAG